MKYTLELVTNRPELWESSDPVRPDLSSKFKSATGREVFGLKDTSGTWQAFMCFARTSDVPVDVEELDRFTSAKGDVAVPYTVWSFEKGAGRTIINEVLSKFRKNPGGVSRVVTLSPPTSMARKFHLRNNAFELRVNNETVNFEYKI